MCKRPALCLCVLACVRSVAPRCASHWRAAQLTSPDALLKSDKETVIVQDIPCLAECRVLRVPAAAAAATAWPRQAVVWDSVGSVLSANAQQIDVAGVYDMLFHAIEVFVYLSAAGIAAALHALCCLCSGTTHVLLMFCRPVQAHVLAAQKAFMCFTACYCCCCLIGQLVGVS